MKKAILLGFFCWIPVHATKSAIQIDLLNSINFSDIGEIDLNISQTTLQEMLNFQKIIKKSPKTFFPFQANNSQTQSDQNSFQKCMTYCSKCKTTINSRKHKKLLIKNIDTHIRKYHARMEYKTKKNLRVELTNKIQYD